MGTQYAYLNCVLKGATPCTQSLCCFSGALYQPCNDPVAVNKATIISPRKYLLSFDFIGLFDQKTVYESLVSVDVKQYAFSLAILVGKWSNSSSTRYI